MQMTISKWGNSLALRLPAVLAKDSNLHEGSTVRVEAQADGSFIVTPVARKFVLADLLAQMPDPSGEVDWGKSEGREAW